VGIFKDEFVLKKLGSYALTAAIFAAMIAVPVLFIKGALWAAQHLIQPLHTLGWWLLTTTLFIALPLAISKRMRGSVAVAIFYSSFVYGLLAWPTGFVVAYMHWGVFGVLLGLFLGFVGVVPIGMLASAFNGWDDFGSLLELVVLSFASRAGAFMLLASAAKHQAAKDDASFTDTTVVE
jgi:hypothetical protein